MSMDVWYEIILLELAEQDRMRELLRDAEEVVIEDETEDDTPKPA